MKSIIKNIFFIILFSVSIQNLRSQMYDSLMNCIEVIYDKEINKVQIKLIDYIEIKSLSIYNLTGNLVLSDKFVNTRLTLIQYNKYLQPGIYFLYVETKKFTLIKKFIINNQ